MGHAPEQIELGVPFPHPPLGRHRGAGETCFGSYFTGIGRTRYVMVADVLAINIPLTYLLVFGAGPVPALGIAGAAWAIVASSVTAVAVFAGFYFRREHRMHFAVAASLHLDSGILRRWMRLGVPAGVEQFLNVAAFNLFLLMFQSYGVGIRVCGDRLQLGHRFLHSHARPERRDHQPGRPLRRRGQSGAHARGGVGRSRDGHRLLERDGGSILLCPRTARGDLPVQHPGSRSDPPLATMMMIGLSAYTMADAVILIVGGVLRGAGDTKWLMWASILLHWLMLIVEVFVIEVWELARRAGLCSYS